MSHWLLDELETTRTRALKQANRSQIRHELLHAPFSEDAGLIQRTAEALEMVVFDRILGRIIDNEEKEIELKSTAADAFRLMRVLPRSEDPIESAMFILRACALAVIGDMGPDAARWLREYEWAKLPLESNDWSKRTWATILDIWLRLIRKRGWTDRDVILKHISELRTSQSIFEKNYLDEQEPVHVKASALELMGLYHLAKAAEVLAYYMTDGAVNGKYQIHSMLEMSFRRAIAVCEHTQLLKLEPLARLLFACSIQMADNSIWTVTRSVNSRVTDFVKTLVDRGRGDRAIFDVLPPQRRTLAEKGLLGSSRRAVVVSLPTSSGKTLIAQFRILQALNQFEYERGWVAYLAPTRTLVSQIARKLRKDFEGLKIIVEQVSPALEVDNIEAELLTQKEFEFRVLVTTPEKLDLMLRQDWEAKIGRPLTLVVVDEAHNIQNTTRGLRLELLLSTINNECQRAQFLLMTPFIKNAHEIARWLGGRSSDDISCAIDWQPNDRIIGIVQAEKGEQLNARSFDYQLKMESIHTTKNTLTSDGLLPLKKNVDIASTYAKVNNQGTLAAVTAQRLHERGPLIIMHSSARWVWSLAKKFRIDANLCSNPTESIVLVQQFLELEFGADFPLIDLLSYRIGVHHAGLSDDVRGLMEWLFEENELDFLVATTTIAQGVNFPVTGVVMASHQYPDAEKRRMIKMPPEDFWNIAGRAGRIDHGSLGVVALVADNKEKAEKLREFINEQVGDLNSALIALAIESKNMLGNLKGIVQANPEWSTFVQYLAHTYRQMGKPEGFVDEIEQILRGTLGFEKLQHQEPVLASRLLEGIYEYAHYLSEPNRPIKLVDSTGFSLQSITNVLFEISKQKIRNDVWDGETLFRKNNRNLEKMMGVLLGVPELRKNLNAVTGGPTPNGSKLALIIKDWVNGVKIPELAERYFMEKTTDLNTAITYCGQNLFSKLTHTAAWGLGALLSITGSNLSEEVLASMKDLPSRVFYGVNNDSAISLRLLGVPRAAAPKLASSMGNIYEQPLSSVRTRLRNMDAESWKQALGRHEGKVYRKVWRILEGLE